MGFLDGLLKQAMGGQSDASGLGGLVSMVSKNPQIVAALAGLLSTRTHRLEETEGWAA